MVLNSIRQFHFRKRQKSSHFCMTFLGLIKCNKIPTIKKERIGEQEMVVSLQSIINKTEKGELQLEPQLQWCSGKDI